MQARAARRSRTAGRSRRWRARSTLSRWPAPTKREGAGLGCDLRERRRDVLLRRRRRVEQLAGVSSQLRAAAGCARAARAASPACCSSRARPAVPCPTRRRRTRAGDALAVGRPGRQRVVVVAAAPARGTVPRRELVAGRPPAARTGTRFAWIRAASVSSLSSFARASSAAWCSASSRSRSCAACTVRSKSRAFSIAVAVCSASVFSSLSSAAVYAIGIVLPSAMTPITRSPTFSGAQMSALMRRCRLIVRRGSLSTSLTISPIAARGDRADDALAAPEARASPAARRRTRRPVVSVSGLLVEQQHDAVGGDDEVTRLLQRELRDALDVEQRRQLLREAVDQIDLAIEVQHLGAERLLLDVIATPGVEQRRHGRRVALGPATQPSTLRRRASPGTRPRRRQRGAVEHAPVGVLDGTRGRRAPRPRAVSSASRAGLAPRICRRRDAAHHGQRPSTSRAFSSRASGSNGLVM